jgi:glycosyltransferase involved in cell wall biosynthesis
MNAPRVSVILPTFNRAHLLDRAARSVLAQTWSDFELVIVDDASSDDTPAVVAALADPRVVSIRLESNRGAAAARNAGIAVARGELLAFLDSDDEWKAEKLERQVAALDAASDRAALCVCSLDVHRGRESFAMVWPDDECDGERALARILGGTGYATPTWLVRHGAIADAGGFDESLPRLQDYELTIRIAERWHIVTMSEKLVTMHVQPDSLSASADGYATAITAILQRHRELFARRPDGHSHMLFRAGKYYALEGNRAAAMLWFRRALGVRPTNIRALGGLLLGATGLMTAFTRMKYRR